MNKVRAYQVLLLLLSTLVLAACAAAPSPTPDAGSQSAASDGQPVIHLFNNSGTLQFDTGGSNPDVLQRVEDLIAEESGVRPVVIVPSEPGADQINLLLGSSDPVDMFQTPTSGGWHDYAEAIIPIDDLLAQHGQALLSVIPEAQWEIMKNADGQIMGIPRSTPTNPYITWVRQDWLDELGLEVPTTLEELEAVVAAFKEYNPDAMIGTTSANIMWSTLGGFTPNGMSNWLDPADNMVKPWIMQPGVREWITKMNEWWENGYFFADTFTQYDAPELFRTCNVGVWMGWYSRITLITPQIESACEGIQWTRTSISGPMGYMATVSPQSASGYVVTRKAENPGAVIQFMNWVYDADSVRNQLIARYGIPEEMWWFVESEGDNIVVDRNADSGYVSEYMMPNLNVEIRYSVLDPARAWHNEYLGTALISLDDAKMPFDAGVPYNLSRINDEVPTRGDIQRLLDEQIVLFITGQRPLEDWDAFMDELSRAGIETWSEAITAQYNALTGQ
ncbi:extracellular solute-binding protein [bacterium]|nr:extracellular solute-binding protein [bacterium]